MQKKHKMMTKIKTFLKSCVDRVRPFVVALRPWSFAVSLTPVALGSVLAEKVTGTYSVWSFVITCCTVLCVHSAGNVVNTYFDYVKGIDSKKSDDRTLVDQLLTKSDVVTLGGILYTLGCVGFLLLLVISEGDGEQLTFVYFFGLSSSFLYTGGLGLKYVGLGDILVFLSFGPLSVLFSFIAQGGQLHVTPLLYALPLALNTQAILHANNTRDMDSDKEAGIVTLAILLGFMGSYVLFVALLFLPYVIFFALSVKNSLWFLLPVTTIVWAFFFERKFRSKSLTLLPQSMAILNLGFGLLYIVSIACTKPENLPGVSLEGLTTLF